MIDDQKMLEALRDGDPQALSEVFELYSDRIYRLALSLLHDEQAADGVVQDTFMALIEHLDSFEGRSSIGTWLYRVAYNNCMGRLRQVRPQIDVEDGDAGMPERFIDWQTIPETLMTGAEAMAQVEKALETLSPALRTVFILRDIEELSTEEVAQALDISISAVKVRLHRARLALREALSTYFEEALV
jgi:RNA polymerase sigma-70 factor (ECF subfamily)